MVVEGRRFFKTEFYEEVRRFLGSIHPKATEKILWNIDLAEQTNDPRLFKKLTDDIWEFRTRYQNIQYRLLAFWDKTRSTDTVVLATHGLIKKADKMPRREIEQAMEIRRLYFSAEKGNYGNKK